MALATFNPKENYELIFDINITGTTEEPSDIRFIIEPQALENAEKNMKESMTVDGEEVKDAFSIICRAVRTDNAIKVYIPRLLNLYKAGTYRSKLEVVLENNLFTVIDDHVIILEDIKIESAKLSDVVEHTQKPKIKVSLSDIVENLLDERTDKDKMTKDKVLDKIKVESKPLFEPSLFPELKQGTNQGTDQDIKPHIKLEKTEKIIDKNWREKGFLGLKNPFI